MSQRQNPGYNYWGNRSAYGFSTKMAWGLLSPQMKIRSHFCLTLVTICDIMHPEKCVPFDFWLHIKVQEKRPHNVSCMVQLQAEGWRQRNTDKSCLLVPFISALNTWQNHDQVLPDTGHANPFGHRGEEIRRIFSAHPSRWSLIKNMIFHWHWWDWYKDLYFQLHSLTYKTSARSLHLVQMLKLPPEDRIRRLKTPEESF